MRDHGYLYLEFKRTADIAILADVFNGITGFTDDLANIHGFRVRLVYV
jgi:hypothetical protein